MGFDQPMLILLSLFLIAASEPPPTATKAPPPAASAPPPTVVKVPPTGAEIPPAATEPVPAVQVAAGEGTIFQTKKGLADIEKCLTDRLSQVGEVTSVPIEGVKTLMYRTTDEPPMMIDLAPPSVKVTTKFAIGTEPIVKGCL